VLRERGAGRELTPTNTTQSCGTLGEIGATGDGALTFFDVLGVPESASDDEVASAHRRLAREFHPDAHPGASAAERASYEAAMAQINVAYDAIKTSQRRASYARAEERGHAAPTARAPGDGECDLCGSVPAQQFVFEYQTAWLLTVRRYVSSAELCRQCALAMGRGHQNRTLYAGWWGVAALFTNFGVVARNARQLQRARQLAPPQPQLDVIAPLPYPAPHSKGTFRRGGVWFATLLLAGLCVVVFLVGQNASTRPEAVPDAWSASSCVLGTERPTPIDCGKPHDAKVVGRVFNPADCPASADGYITRARDAFVYCIDRDQ
jgi:hypothetical protein